jgi:hypothetical protein
MTNDDYLWDRSGEADAEVEQLERTLAEFRRPLPPLRIRGQSPLSARRKEVTVPFFLATAAAVTLLVAAAGWFARASNRAGYAVAAASGAPRVGGDAIDRHGRLRAGDWLETDAASRATIEVGAIGRVDVDPNTRVRMVRARATEHRLALASGRIHATIWAPPRFFFVETPSAVAVDLGCAYTLEVDGQGAGLLRVLHGWVGFEHEGRESFIPEKALCRTRPGIGPGTPYLEDAPAAFANALTAIDFGDPAARGPAVDLVIARARPRDALSLWHLLTRVEGDDRDRVYARLAALVPPPAAVTREGIARGNRQMLDAWWNELGLESAAWWRVWKAPWPKVR